MIVGQSCSHILDNGRLELWNETDPHEPAAGVLVLHSLKQNKCVH